MDAEFHEDIPKIYVDANQLMRQSIVLAKHIYDSNFLYDSPKGPDGTLLNFLVGIWRGGTPPGIYIQEFLRRKGVQMYHMSIKTESYIGLGQPDPPREVVGLQDLVERVLVSRLVRSLGGATDLTERLLFIDDVFDSGRSIKKILEQTDELFKDKINKVMGAFTSYLAGKRFDYLPDKRVATVYYKPEKNKTDIKPDYPAIETNQWIVFAHELTGISDQEIKNNKDPVFSQALTNPNFYEWAKNNIKLPK